MKRIRVLIIDDEPIVRWGLRSQLGGEPDVEILGECANGLEAVTAIEELSPDLVFLDVQMPGLDGFGVIEAIGPERMPTVIFVTAYDEYALRAFEVNALDYLLKPFNQDRFFKALQRARASIERLGIGNLDQRLLALINERPGRPKYIERLVIKSSGRIFFLGVEEVDWIEASDNYVELHAGRESHLLRESLSGLEARLDPAKFLRIRHSIIVNIEKVKELRLLANSKYVIILRDGTELASSRRYRKKLNALLGQ